MTSATGSSAPPGDQRARLRRRYLSLGAGELVSAAVFVTVGIAYVVPILPEQHGAAALWSALGPLVIILVQAGCYWLAARSWVVVGTMPPALATTYRILRWLGPPLLTLGLAGLIWWWPGSRGPGLLLVGIWAFGVIEYLNYYVVRLAFPPSRWLRGVRQRRTPRLVQDLRAAG